MLLVMNSEGLVGEQCAQFTMSYCSQYQSNYILLWPQKGRNLSCGRHSTKI